MNGLTVKEAARELGVSRSRIYRLIQTGRLGVLRPAERIHGRRGRINVREMILAADDVKREKEARS